MTLKLSFLTAFIFDLCTAIDRNMHGLISAEEVKDRIATGDLFPYLERRIGKTPGIGTFLKDPKLADDFIAKLRDISEEYGGVARRKWGIENNGICLLIVWTAEIIQQKLWD